MYRHNVTRCRPNKIKTKMAIRLSLARKVLFATADTTLYGGAGGIMTSNHGCIKYEAKASIFTVCCISWSRQQLDESLKELTANPRKFGLPSLCVRTSCVKSWRWRMAVVPTVCRLVATNRCTCRVYLIWRRISAESRVFTIGFTVVNNSTENPVSRFFSDCQGKFCYKMEFREFCKGN